MGLLNECFAKMTKNVWWRILPNDEMDNICVGMSIDWEDLLPLLINAGLIFIRNRSAISKFFIDHQSWSTLAATFQEKIVIGSHNNGVNRDVFICRGMPIYDA